MSKKVGIANVGPVEWAHMSAEWRNVYEDADAQIDWFHVLVVDNGDDHGGVTRICLCR